MRGVGGTAAGQTDFTLTSVYYLLAARQQSRVGPGPRFVAVVHDRSPLAAFVPLDSPLRAAGDVGGRRVAASTAPWFDLEFQAALRALGLPPAVFVGPSPSGERASMVRGEVDIIGSWAEAIAVIRHRAEVPVRSIPLGPDVYATGLAAAGHVPDELARRMATAFAAALDQQRRHPSLGLDDLCRDHPRVDPAAALEEWDILTGYLRADGPGRMRADRWQRTLDHVCATHGFSPAVAADVCREGLLDVQAVPVTAGAPA